jgi:hypothetical protein
MKEIKGLFFMSDFFHLLHLSSCESSFFCCFKFGGSLGSSMFTVESGKLENEEENT